MPCPSSSSSSVRAFGSNEMTTSLALPRMAPNELSTNSAVAPYGFHFAFCFDRNSAGKVWQLNFVIVRLSQFLSASESERHDLHHLAKLLDLPMHHVVFDQLALIFDLLLDGQQ